MARSWLCQREVNEYHDGKNKHVQLFFRSCSKYRLQSPSRQRHGITLSTTLLHFSFFLELIATFFSRGFFLFCDKDKWFFLHKKEGLTPTGLGVGYIYTWCGRAETLAICLSCQNYPVPCTASVTFLDHQTGAETRVKSTVVNEKQSPSFKSRAGGVGNTEHHDFQFLCSNTSWIRVSVSFSAMRKSRRSTLSAFLLPCALTSTFDLMSRRESEALGMVRFGIATAGSSHSVPNGDHRLEDNLRDRSGVERLHQPVEQAHPTVLWGMLGAREHVKSPVERRAWEAWTCNPPCSLIAVLGCASVHRSDVSAHCSARVCQTLVVGKASVRGGRGCSHGAPSAS